MQVLIVEDELLLAKRLQKLLKEIDPEITVCGMTHSIQETLEWLGTKPLPDLIFMDIELADGQCFDIFGQTELVTPIIFTTAYDEYAIRAFRVNSIDYLLKPIKPEELERAIRKFRQSLLPQSDTSVVAALLAQLKNAQEAESIYRERFLVKQGQKLISIPVKEVAYLFSENKFTYLRTFDNRKYILDYSLEELESGLSPREFFRVNRQFILHQRSVTAIHSWFNQKLKIEVEPAMEEAIVISRDKANAFKVWMGE